MSIVDVTRTHLVLRSGSDLRPARTPSPTPQLTRRRPISADEYRSLYTLVGDRWFWHDRLAWPEGLLDAHLERAEVHVWVATVGDDVAGYFELAELADGAVELMYFGLAPAWMGRGLGGWLLTRATEIAFGLGARRVVLNTCTLDSPHALPNYLARGFSIVREEQYQADLPSASPAAAD